jgi:hypothetical protein
MWVIAKNLDRNVDQDDRLGGVNLPRAGSLARLQPPEIVGEVANPLFETLRRLWWRAFDRVCYWTVVIRLSIHDRIYGAQPPAECKREADHDDLVPLGSPYL